MSLQMPEDDPRTVAGRYEIEDVLGRGGMGAVYRVYDVRTDKHVALKRGFTRDVSKLKKRQALLEREYHTLAQLAHPRIIEVYDYGIDEEGPYYTMELLDGADLDNRGKVPWREACGLLCDVASSLAILHSRGLLHRDVSARNVRCTADGRAKLLDFGAMISMGVAKEVLGTPPYIAPETLQLQSLDARSDLYSLGALGYHLLTGRHAFAVKRLHELRDAWRSPPMSPLRFAPDVPVALSSLVLQLLSLDRTARPQSAGEVMERLSVIAGFPLEDHPEASRAYLSTPTLVGREAALTILRKRILAMLRGHSGTLLIEGVEGSGRSRMLDACVLEGKLLGATVLRADASDGATGDWGVARALATQVLETLPESALLAARYSRGVLGHVIDGLRGETWSRLQPIKPERSLLLREMREFFVGVAAHQKLLITVDDADQIDEPSAALLAALAHKTDRGQFLLAIVVESESLKEPTPSLSLLRSVATPIAVSQLRPEQTETLMRSVFGDVEKLPVVAMRIHALAQGNPRATMELAQHLVDRGLARYQAGSWGMPAVLDEGDLPTSLAAGLQARLLRLTPDARELCDVLCVADDDALSLEDYAALTAHGDGRRVYQALDELCAAHIVIAEGEQHRFCQRGFLSVVNELMAADRRAWIHARLTAALDKHGGDTHRSAHHLLRCGREREAIDLIMSDKLIERLPPVPLLEELLRASERLGMAARQSHRLRIAILTKAPIVLDAEAFRRELPSVLAQLRHDSGLDDYDALADVPEPDRLRQARARAKHRFYAASESERVYSPNEAVTELARLSGNLAAVGAQVNDLALLEMIPSLQPMIPTSPVLGLLDQFAEGCREGLRGQSSRALNTFAQVLARVEEPDGGGLDQTGHRSMRLGLHLMLGLFKSSTGIESAEDHVAIIEADRGYRISGWRVRVSLYLNQGNVDKARRSQRRAELLQLQETGELRYVGANSGTDFMPHAMAGDLIGIKRSLDAVEALAQRFYGWRAVRYFGLCHCRWLQGDLAGALEAALQGLATAPAGRHSYFCCLAGAHIGLLSQSGQVEQAVAVGREYLAVSERLGLRLSDRWVKQALAEALTEAGEFQQAVTLIDANNAEAESLGLGALILGVGYEVKARIALRMGDRATYEAFAERCASEYRKGKNPVLSARYARLVEAGREQPPAEGSRPSRAPGALTMSATETGFGTVQSLMLECVDQGDRARCALALLLQSMNSAAGFLYGIDAEGTMCWLAALPNEPADERLSTWLEVRLREEIAVDENATVSVDGSDAEGPRQAPSRFTDAAGRNYDAVFLASSGGPSARIAAVLAVLVQPGPRTVAPQELLVEIAGQLIDHGDVLIADL